MQANWRLGSLFGIPFYINSSWLAILLLVTISNAAEVQATGALPGNAAGWLGWPVGLCIALLLFASVLLHELGHSLTAKAQGIEVNSITLFLFGGVAAIERESDTPGRAFQVAIAGPLVSFALFAVFANATQLWPGASLWQLATSDLARINLVLGGFNLLPGLPLDGGQVLKAAVWRLTGDRLAGSRWAARAGLSLGAIGIAFGLAAAIAWGSLGTVWLSLISWFIFRNANNYRRVTHLQQVLLELSAADVMTREFRVVDATASARQLTDELFALGDRLVRVPCFAAADGRYRGLVRWQALQGIAAAETTPAELAIPLSEIPHVRETTRLADVVVQLEASRQSWLTVLNPAETVAGVLNWGDIVKAIAERGVWKVSEAQLQEIVAEGRYPASMRLGAIARITTQSHGGASDRPDRCDSDKQT